MGKFTKLIESIIRKFNEYFNGENLFLDPIPQIPDFDNSGTVRTASELNLNTSDFVNLFQCRDVLISNAIKLEGFLEIDSHIIYKYIT